MRSRKSDMKFTAFLANIHSYQHYSMLHSPLLIYIFIPPYANFSPFEYFAFFKIVFWSRFAANFHILCVYLLCIYAYFLHLLVAKRARTLIMLRFIKLQTISGKTTPFDINQPPLPLLHTY